MILFSLCVNNLNSSNSYLTVGCSSGVAHREGNGICIYGNGVTGEDISAIKYKTTGLVGLIGDLDGNDGLALSSGEGELRALGLVNSPVTSVDVVLTGILSRSYGSGDKNLLLKFYRNF